MVECLARIYGLSRNKGVKKCSPVSLISPIVSSHMKSMTGYGRGESAQDGFKVTVELSSVNRKQSEVSVALPRELEVLEAQIRDEINQWITRGRLTARGELQ